MAETNKQKVRVLFLNTRDRLGADVAVHVMLARALDRTAVDVWAATSTYEAPGASTHAQLERIPDLRLLPIELGQPLSNRHGVARALALARNMQGIFSLAQLAWLCRRERVDIIHVTERPRDALFGLLLARAAGAACLIHAHTSYYAHNASRLDNWMLRRADALVGVSRFTAQTYIRDAHVPASRVFAVHNAADPVQFVPMSADAAGGAHPPGALRLYAAWKLRKEEQENPALRTEAASQSSEASATATALSVSEVKRKRQPIPVLPSGGGASGGM